MHEHSQQELKAKLSNTFLKTVSAFANYNGGRIFFGVNDDGETIGLTNPAEDALRLENKINTTINPVPEFSLVVNKEQKTILLQVEAGMHKPYFYQNKAYKRSHTSTVEVDRTALQRLVLEGTNTRFEELPASSQALTFDYLAGIVKDTLGLEDFTEDTLRSLGLFNPDRKANKAAELFSDTNTLPGTDVVRFGTTINQIQQRELLQDMSVLEQFYSALTIYKNNYTYEEIVGVERVAVEQIPQAAFREALANALIHRAYDLDIATGVAMFPDRIEITSPGGLPPSISEEEYLYKQISYPINPIVANVFFRLQLIERLGFGVQRIQACYRHALVSPTFSVSENAITITLPAMSETASSLSANEQTVFSILSTLGTQSRRELQGITGFTDQEIGQALTSLEDKKAVYKSGRGRGTKYHRN